MIEVSDVTKSYGALEAVRGVSFNVQPREIVGLLGPNGAGKTTLMRILTGYHFPTAGQATVDTHDVYQEPLAIKASIGYLPESSPVYGDLTVVEYLQFVADARGIPPKEQHDRISETAQTCGLTSVLFRSIDKLSKGFKQRVGLAQAIIHNPDILILDEPTTGLDPNQIAEIRKLIRRLGSEKTVILSTHILQEVEAVCDRVLILNEGRIVATGTTDEIAAGVKGDEIHHITVRDPGTNRVPGAQELRESLEGIPGVVGVRDTELFESDTGGEGPHSSFRATVLFGPGASAPDDNAAALFEWAITRKLVLIELRREAFRLEDVFATLTGGDHA